MTLVGWSSVDNADQAIDAWKDVEVFRGCRDGDGDKVQTCSRKPVRVPKVGGEQAFVRWPALCNIATMSILRDSPTTVLGLLALNGQENVKDGLLCSPLERGALDLSCGWQVQSFLDSNTRDFVGTCAWQDHAWEGVSKPASVCAKAPVSFSALPACLLASEQETTLACAVKSTVSCHKA